VGVQTFPFKISGDLSLCTRVCVCVCVHVHTSVYIHTYLQLQLVEGYRRLLGESLSGKLPDIALTDLH